MSSSVREYLRLVKQWWWLLVVSAIIPMAVTYYFASNQPNLYEAKVTLMVGTTLESANPDPTLMATSNYLARAYASLATSGPVTEAVIERLGLNRPAERLASQITPFVYPEANLLEIQVVDTNPRAAALIANALAEELIARTPTSDELQQSEAAFVWEQLEDVKAKIEKVEADIREARDSLADLTSAADIQEVQDRISQLEEVVGMYRALYSNLLRSHARSSPNILQIFDPAVEPSYPIERWTFLFVAIAGVAGLGLALGAVFLIEYLDDAVRWEGEMKRILLGMSVLGAIAKMRGEKGSIADAVSPESPFARMVRALRTNIYLAADDRGLETLLITSPAVKAGKTFCVAQLGLAIAAEGRRVLMVDADLRRPGLNELFDLPNLFGLSELLADDAPLTSSAWPRGVQETGVENLYLLPAGKPPLDPGSLLISPRLNELFDALKKQADVILIDSPPELVAPDAAVLASAADGTLMVVSAGITKRKKILETKERLTQQEGVNLLGVAFNRVKLNRGGYYYYSYSRKRRWQRRGFWGRLRTRLPFLGGVSEDGKLILNLVEMADSLGVSRGTARRWCKSGRIPAFRSWFRWRIKEEDLRVAIGRMVRSEET